VSGSLAVVLLLLAAAIVMFALGRPRMDVVGLLALVALPLTGVLTLPEALAGFADPNVILVAALFVVGEGLSRAGVTYRLGDWLAAHAGDSGARLVVLLMLCVAALGSVMSSTGVVAIFVPVALAVAKRLAMSPRQLLMPLSFAGLISGMLTLIATAPNLVVNAELARHGLAGFGFFAPTPFGLVILVLGMGYMLLLRRRMSPGSPLPDTASRRTIADLLDAYDLTVSLRRLRILPSSSLNGHTLLELELPTRHGLTVLVIERGPRWHRELLPAGPATRLLAGDVLTAKTTGRPQGSASLADLGVELLEFSPERYARQARQIGMAEVMLSPNSGAGGRRIADLSLDRSYGLTVIGLRHQGRPAAGPLPRQRAEAGDTLLAVGEWAAIDRLNRRGTDFLLLDLPTEVEETAPAGNRAWFALASLLVMVVLMVSGVVPNVLAALIACLLMGASGCIDMPAAYRAIHWPTLLVIIGMLPFAQALEKTGGVDLAASGLLALVGGAGPSVILAAIFLVTALIGLFVSNTATAVLMAPVSIAIAQQLGASPYPFAMTVALAASAAFMTPVSSPVNTLIVEPGRYRFTDFVKVGTPFTLVVMLVVSVMVPLVLPVWP
jgi:di/tricarboxylate transporter